MRFKILCLTMSALISAVVCAQSNGRAMGDVAAIALIHQMEEDARPSAEMVTALVEDGRSVGDATALIAGVAATAVVRSYSTLFGMCLAPDKDEISLDVGAAAQAAAGEGDQDVATTVSQFTVDQCQQFYPYLRPPGALGETPRGPLVPPVSPAN